MLRQRCTILHLRLMTSLGEHTKKTERRHTPERPKRKKQSERCGSSANIKNYLFLPAFIFLVLVTPPPSPPLSGVEKKCGRHFFFGAPSAPHQQLIYFDKNQSATMPEEQRHVLRVRPNIVQKNNENPTILGQRHYWKPVFLTILLKVSIGRDFGALKGLRSPRQSEKNASSSRKVLGTSII